MIAIKTLWILENQLNNSLEGFKKIDPKKDWILFIESKEHISSKKVHKKKLILILSAMRHFSLELQNLGYNVDYRKVDNFYQGLQQHLSEHPSSVLFLHEPTSYPFTKEFKEYEKKLGESMGKIDFEILSENPLFLVEKKEWEKILQKDRTWKQDLVYQKLRKRFNILMVDGKPLGGKWSFDTENRKPPKDGLSFEKALEFSPDNITLEVIKDIEMNYPNNFGSTDNFKKPVTQMDAKIALDYFINNRLKTFGDYQDSMIEGNPEMSHSLLSDVINLGLITPLEIIKKAEDAYKKNIASLSSVEGFIRQVLGWREYIRGVYLQSMPEYNNLNYLNHENSLPIYYWTGDTDLNCVATAIQEVKSSGYNHHIQRLMILCNWANLLRVKPKYVVDWFLEVYIDAYDWVVIPNVLGMGLYADGGQMSTKPYISSGQYIHKMSTYCSNCKFDINKKIGEKACPFNALYWTFLEDHRDLLSSNPRMKLMYGNWDRQDPEKRDSILKKGRELLKSNN